MRRATAVFLLAGLVAGCPTPPRTPETETPDQTIARQTAELKRLQADLAERDALIQRLRDEFAAAQGLNPQFADAEVRVERVVLGRFSHVAHFEKSRPGPNGLKVYLFLEDRDGVDIKRAGLVHFKAFDLKRERKLGDWAFDPREALKHWMPGFPLNCFVFELPWQDPATDEKDADVFWEFTDLYGRRFEGTQALSYTTEAIP